MLTDRYATRIRGVLSCFDRILVTGTLPAICHAQAFTRELNRRRIRIFDFTKFAEPLRDAIRENAERLARENGLTIEFIRKIGAFRKEDRIQEILAERGTHPGLVHIFSAIETCASFQPWHDKRSGKTFLKPDTGKCLHYYFYFIDPDLGLCHLRVPTWAPFRLQFCMNGHNWLASRLRRLKIGFKLVDNAFVDIDDFERAQQIADRLKPQTLHRKLDRFARQFCPAASEFTGGYHWSLMQIEYATDIVFKRRDDLAPVYDHLVRTAVHAVRAEHVATFLGKKLDPRYLGEVGNDFNTRIQGTRIRHRMGPVALKMYDKFGCVLRIETVANDVSFFKHHRTVEHRDGSSETKLAPVKKTIYSLSVVADLLRASNRRYLEFLSSLDDDSAGRQHLERLSRPVHDEMKRSYRGLNFFDAKDRTLLLTLARGEFNLRGFQVRDLRRILTDLTGPQLSRQIKRLRMHRLVKKVRGTYKYYLTRLGRRVIAAALRLREDSLIPALAGLPA
jgi:DNA-binding transcriptional ArsR family regulator